MKNQPERSTKFAEEGSLNLENQPALRVSMHSHYMEETGRIVHRASLTNKPLESEGSPERNDELRKSNED